MAKVTIVKEGKGWQAIYVGSKKVGHLSGTTEVYVCISDPRTDNCGHPRPVARFKYGSPTKQAKQFVKTVLRMVPPAELVDILILNSRKDNITPLHLMIEVQEGRFKSQNSVVT